jgi:hypothetical protein
MHLPGAEVRSFGIGQLGDGRDMPAWDQNQPSGQDAVERMCHPPKLIRSDPLHSGRTSSQSLLSHTQQSMVGMVDNGG